MKENRYLNRITNIEYSRLPGFAGNSELHFLKAATDGFDGMKADMRLSKDGEIVLCHDPGYTFDAEGRITVFNKDNFTEIHDLELAQIRELEFDTPDESGNYYHPCLLDSMLRICRDNDLIPYLTNRHEDWREETAGHMFKLLEKYGLTDKAIMNLYAGNPDTMSAIRKFIPNADACDTKHREDVFSKEMIDESAKEGYKIICLCHFSDSPVTKELIGYAEKKNISIWEWGMTTAEEVRKYLELGVKGFQMYTRDVTNAVIRNMGF